MSPIKHPVAKHTTNGIPSSPDFGSNAGIIVGVSVGAGVGVRCRSGFFVGVGDTGVAEGTMGGGVPVGGGIEGVGCSVAVGLLGGRVGRGDDVGVGSGGGVSVGRTGVAVGGIGVEVGGTDVLVGGLGVSVGGTGVLVDGTGVLVGGTGVLVGGTGVLVGGTGVLVGGFGVGVGIGANDARLPTMIKVRVRFTLFIYLLFFLRGGPTGALFGRGGIGSGGGL